MTSVTRFLIDNKIMVKTRGFTLAELLIALSILGVVATFTIPKVLVAQQDAGWKSSGKEVASMISGAYSAYKFANGESSATLTSNLTSYMNYVQVDTTTTVDSVQGGGSYTCSAANPACLRLHNGGILYYWPNDSFGGTATTNAIAFVFDPDGEYAGSTDGPGKSLSLWVYYNGKVRTRGTLDANTYTGATLMSTCANCDPPWFSWD